MKFSLDYISDLENKDKVLKAINWVRLYLKILLPYELVGKESTNETHSFLHNEQSLITWKYKFPTISKPNKSSVDIWTKFK